MGAQTSERWCLPPSSLGAVEGAGGHHPEGRAWERSEVVSVDCEECSACRNGQWTSEPEILQMSVDLTAQTGGRALARDVQRAFESKPLELRNQ